MREMTGDVLVYESILNLYYDENAKRYLNQKLIAIIDSFVEYCKAKDMMDNTKIAETMEIVYRQRNEMSGEELKKMLALSGSSL